jgi:uncharacterized protein YneF (UPF0154 family)
MEIVVAILLIILAFLAGYGACTFYEDHFKK